MMTDQICSCFLSWQNTMLTVLSGGYCLSLQPHPQCPVGRRRGRQLLICKVRQLALGPALISSLSDCDPSTFRGCTNSDNATLAAQLPVCTIHFATAGLMLSWRRRRRHNIKPAVDECLVFPGMGLFSQRGTPLLQCVTFIITSWR